MHCLTCISNLYHCFNDRFGSVIIDHEVYSSDTKETLKIDTANSMVKLLRQDEKIVFFNQSTEVKKITLFTGNISIGKLWIIELWLLLLVDGDNALVEVWQSETQYFKIMNDNFYW